MQPTMTVATTVATTVTPSAPSAPRALLLGPSGTVRDLVAAILTIQGIDVAVRRVEGSAEAGAGHQGGDGDFADPGVLVLVSPGPEEWDVVRSWGGGAVLVSEGPLSRQEALEAVLSGADAIVHTDDSPTELARAVAAVERGETLLDPAAARLVAAAARSARVGSARQLRLTPRELDILRSVEQGQSVKQTARALGVTNKTVENLQTRLFRKLGARNRAHAVALAHRLGLFEHAAAVPALVPSPAL